MIKLITNKTRNTTINIQAIFIERPATPVAPKIPATSANTKNAIAQLNMTILP